MKTIIEMAREANLPACLATHPKALKRFAEFVRADEREACAKVCEHEWSNAAEREFGEECAAAIRARGNL